MNGPRTVLGRVLAEGLVALTLVAMVAALALGGRIPDAVDRIAGPALDRLADAIDRIHHLTR